MSATGLGVTFWNDMLTAGTGPGGSGLGIEDASVGGFSNHLLYLTDRDYTITHIFFSNNGTGTTPILVRLGIKLAGAALGVGTDGRKVFTISLDSGQLFDLSTRIPVKGGYGIIGIANAGFGPGTDVGVWASITGEVSD